MNKHRALVVDDSALQCKMWRLILERRFGDRIDIRTFTDPTEVVDHLGPDVDLLIVDWQMPGMDGHDVLTAARERGMSPKRVIVASARCADDLHEEFELGECLAVIEKDEPEQQAALWMILEAMLSKPPRMAPAA